MADVELIVPSGALPHHFCHHLVRVQGPCRDIRPFNGGRCNLWPICRNHRQGHLSVGHVHLDI